MPGNVMKRVEALLQSNDPLTIGEIMARTGCKHQSIWYACKTHPLIYIDHWRVAGGAAPQWVAAYSIIDRPADTPKPTVSPSVYDQKQKETWQ
jgi:hypothetical protein